MQRLQSNGELRDSLREFYNGSVDASNKAEINVARVMREMLMGVRPNRIANRVLFEVSDELNLLCQNIVNLCVRILGPAHGSEKDIAAVLWRVAGRAVLESLNNEDTVKLFFADLQTEVAATKYFVAPNRLFRFERGVDIVHVGPVTVARGESLTDFLKNIRSDIEWTMSEHEIREGYSARDGVLVNVDSTSWVVRVDASPRNVREEAEWSIDVAVSLLRCIAVEHMGAIAARFGNIEPDPIRGKSQLRSAFMVNKSQFSDVDQQIAIYYEIGERALQITQSVEFSYCITHIFESAKGTTGSRMAQGLGWLTRGRRAQDRSESLLHYFTALEALFSKSGDPIAQTIARCASCLISDDVDVRLEIFRKVLKLYETRSKLVHSGMRNATGSDVYYLAGIVELLYRNALNFVDLGESFDEFLNELRDCSFGRSYLKRRTSRIAKLHDGL